MLADPVSKVRRCIGRGNGRGHDDDGRGIGRRVQVMTSEHGEDQLAFLRSVDSPTIANAIEPFKVRDRCEGFVGGSVRCMFPDLGVMVGYALTVTMTNKPGPILSRDGWWRMYEELEKAPKPAVVVVQDLSGAPTRCALFGEVMATLAKRLGAVGIVTDGGVRDVDEVRAMGVQYFAPYAVVSHGNFGIVDVGVPVTIDGQVIQSGDLLHGDANGIVVVPPGLVPQLPETVEKIRVREKRMMDYIKGPDFSLPGLRDVSGY
jgi:4-hydroxy-4-methyl-2-oxoglutarate aldolase